MLKLNKNQIEFLKKYKPEFSNPTDENLNKVFSNATDFGSKELLVQALKELGFKLDFNKYLDQNFAPKKDEEPKINQNTGSADWSELYDKLQSLYNSL